MNPFLQQGIIPLLKGGLGNQLFILAASFAVSKNTGAHLYLLDNPSENNKHNHKSRDYKETIFKHVGIHIPHTIDSAVTHLQAYLFFDPPGFCPWSVELVPPGTVMGSYFQFYPTLIPYIDEFCGLLRKGLESFTDSLLPNHRASSAFLHIRRGDYLLHKDIHFIQPMEYYRNALRVLKGRQSALSSIYIVSDDIAWAKEQPEFQDSLFTFFESDDELETFALMTLCDAGAICANSTYSWWGAYMGAYTAGAPVIVPERWINERVYSLFPSEWIIL